MECILILGNAIHDTAVVVPHLQHPVSQISSYLRHRALFTPHAPDHLETPTAVLAW